MRATNKRKSPAWNKPVPAKQNPAAAAERGVDVRASLTPVGILQAAAGGGMVVLDKPDPLWGREIFVAKKDLNGAPFGMKVVLRCLGKADRSYAEVTEVLGDPGRPDVAIQGILRQYGLKEAFPADVLAEAEACPQQLEPRQIEEELARGRLDLRERHSFTIDGEDARDLDDAIDIEALGEGKTRLWVHIADVSAYVRNGMALDEEAAKRGNSVYLSDRVLPMLPPRLSNGICSLNPEKDRLCLSCRLDFDAAGERLDGEIRETLIRSKYRSSYRELTETLDGSAQSSVDEATEDGAAGDGKEIADGGVKRVIAGDTASLATAATSEKPAWLAEDMRLMRTLAERLGEKRKARGALDFDFPETRCALDADGRCEDIYLERSNWAKQVIESFMVAANEFVAELAEKKNLPTIYRVHEQPDVKRLEEFAVLASLYGIRLRLTPSVRPRELQNVLTLLKGESYAEMLSQQLLRSLAKARYDTRDLGHFGLASRAYCHFTAPIRRYADLFVHRSLKRWLHGGDENLGGPEAQNLAAHISFTERMAMEAERDSVQQKIVEYYAERVGEDAEGKISGFSSGAFYVRLENGAEGAVPYRSVRSGYLDFDERRMLLVNQQSGEIFMVGDPVKIRVARVDLSRRFLDFDLLEHESKSPFSRGKTGRRFHERGVSQSERAKSGGKRGRTERKALGGRRSKGRRLR